MKKVLFIFLSIVAFALSGNAQKFRIGLGPVVSVPVGYFEEYNGIGIGAEFTGVLQLSKSFEAFGQIGYQRFPGKTFFEPGVSIKTDVVSHFPILIGGRYKTKGFLLGAGMGYGNYRSKSSGFTYSPQVGYSFEKIDIIANYTSILLGEKFRVSSVSYFGVKSYFKF
jgi:hypothetical protein